MLGILLLDLDVFVGALFKDGLEHAGLQAGGNWPWNLHSLIKYIIN
jgi:hypothetical protein